MKSQADGSTVLIRLPREEDARPIAEVHVRSWQSAYRDLLSPGFLAGLEQSIERRVAFLVDAIAGGPRTIRVAEVDGEIVGWSSFGASRDDDVPPGTGELMSIYLIPEAWTLGIGNRLWLESRRGLEEAGFHSATAWVLDGNVRATRFYRRIGFTADGASQRTFEENGEPLPLTRFRIALDAAGETPDPSSPARISPRS
ncbi:GNAT family N-acetyltransferase [Zestomonas carbonaria]|uniref:N-acetyltransferase domain-containing protein n=1 Tax=Zestomonas carbonaria TaxID=2762745 RepID=A0A7U7ENU9_9GAMM|nr:GNAT family N-acetyltransferase [Pseudomonas carbonaria]CAD5108394.1 hypothetical protein PSEWESI4_02679 [Pseudomonas carbonaria]